MKFSRVLGTDHPRLNERQRFYLLLAIFNVMLILIIVLLSLRQRLVERVELLEVEVTRLVGCETQVAMLRQTVAFTPSPTPTPTSPPHIALHRTAPPPTNTPTRTAAPTHTSTPAPTRVNTPTPTTTHTLVPTPTPTTPPPTARPPTRPPTTTPITPTPTNTPVTPTPLPPPIVLNITPEHMVRSASGTPVPVVITGSNFFPGATANLGYVSVSVPRGVTETNTIHGTVPVSMSTGIYNLTVKNRGGQSDTLEQAFTVTEPLDPDKTLESSYLVTFGLDSDFSYGYDDHVQLIFFDMPNTVTDPVYIRVYDPATGNDGVVDKFRESDPSWDTVVRFSVYGGPGAYSDPAARASQYMTITENGITAGTLLATRVFTSSQTEAWHTFGSYAPPVDAETVGDRYVFKLAVVGESGNDGNLYNVALSTSPNTNTAPAGARIFAFSWTLVLTDSARPGLYPFLDTSVSTFVQYNCDFDYTDGEIIIRTLEQELRVDKGGDSISRDGGCRSSSYDQSVDYTVAETGASWAVDLAGFRFAKGNTGDDDNENYATFWAAKQGDIALPIFTFPEVLPPP